MLWRNLHLNWRYAIGEFAIVVLGVLAALWVENLNSERKDRVLEREYLLSLLSDFAADERSLDAAIRRSEEIALAQQIVMRAADTKQLDVSPIEFVDAVSEVGLLVFATHSRRTINDLMSTGNLRIIESDEVRNALADYYAHIASRAQWQRNWREYQIHLGKILPEVINWRYRVAFSFSFQENDLPPWIDPVIDISQSDAQMVLDRLIARPNVVTAIENMFRIQTINYQYNNDIKQQLLGHTETAKAYLRELEQR